MEVCTIQIFWSECNKHSLILFFSDSLLQRHFDLSLSSNCGPDSSVGIATELRAGRSGIESRWGWDFPPVQTGPGAHPASCKMGTLSFPGVKCGRGTLLTTHPLLVLRSWKRRNIPLPTLWATPVLLRYHFTFTFILIKLAAWTLPRFFIDLLNNFAL